QNQAHRDADQSECLADVGPGEFPAAEVPEISGDGDDKYEYDPFRGLEVYPSAEVNPATSAEDLLADKFYGDEREDAYPIGPGDDVDEPVVVDHRDQEHQQKADGEEAELLVIEAVKFGVQGRGLDLKHADDGEDTDEAQQDPVEVAIGG